MSGILGWAADTTVPMLCVMIFASGGYFAVLLRLYPFRRPCKLARVFFPRGRGMRSSLSSLRAMTLALAGTLGVGNIVGVASALVEGGKGALFWMWISALFAAVVKFAEIVAAVRTRRSEFLPGTGTVYHGGAMYYIKNKIAASGFAVLVIFGSFFIGNILQVKAASEAVGNVFGVPEIYTSSLIAFICGMILVGGGKRISGFTAALIPLLALCYIGASLYIIISEAAALPSALAAVLRDAFSPASIGIGGTSCTMWGAMRYGITRGLFSSEAGCGSAPIAHAEAHCHSPAEQGCYGIFEVFADTSLLCTLSALVILLAPDSSLSAVGDGTGIDLVIAAFSSRLGDTAGLFISISVAQFALATIVCWAHYATEAIGYLRRSRHERSRKRNRADMQSDGTKSQQSSEAQHGYTDPRRTGSGKRHTSAGYCGTSDTAIFPRSRKKLLPRTDALYIAVYCSAAALSVKISGSAIWSLADLSLAAMTIINLLALLPERQQIAALTFREFSRRRYKRPNKSRNCISTDHGSTTGTVTVEQSSFKQQRRILCANPDRRS